MKDNESSYTHKIIKTLCMAINFFYKKDEGIKLCTTNRQTEKILRWHHPCESSQSKLTPLSPTKKGTQYLLFFANSLESRKDSQII